MRQSGLILLMLASTMLAGGTPATANDMGQMQQMMQQMMQQQQSQSGPNSVPYPNSQYQAPSQSYDNSQGGSPDIQTMMQGMASGRMRNKGNMNLSPKGNQNPMHNGMGATTRY
jgi:hypothetical protein